MTRRRENALFRPPAEAASLILRVAEGCPWNNCTFCGMYKGVCYQAVPLAEVLGRISAAAAQAPETERVFLADGDALALPFEQLRDILDCLNACLPRLTRVSIYANGASILARTASELAILRTLKLHTLYMGLESGADSVLRNVKKRETAAEMVAAGKQAQACGLRMSVMVLTGLAGFAASADHAAATARALNAMQPRLVSVLRVIPVPGTALHGAWRAGRFTMLTEHAAVAELRLLLANLALCHTVFRANHTSNLVPLEGRLPKDQPRLVAALDVLLASGGLDRLASGPFPVAL